MRQAPAAASVPGLMTDGPARTAPATNAAYGAELRWAPERPRLTFFSLLIAWLTAAASLLLAAFVVPGVTIPSAGGALVTALVVAVLNAVLPPLVAALRLPFTLALDFILILLLDALMISAAGLIDDRAIQISSFGWAILLALLASAAGVVIGVLIGTNDDVHLLRTVRRVARRQGGVEETDVPGIIFLEIDGLALPVLQRAMRDGHAPQLARWLGDGTHTLLEWETDFSSQTGASQAGILLGSNDDIPAFRWVEKETGKVMTCSAPADCAEIERRRATGRGLLVDGGGSRGNLLSGEADEVILTVSRMDAEKQANPGYRAFFANGSNVTRVVVLFAWEVILEWSAALRAIRRDVQPRGHRGGRYPFLRAGICVVVRDLIVFGVLLDMMRGRPALYATFSSYDEVAHHSGLERADTLEALRKLDQEFGRIERARRYAPRPYEIVVLSDHGQTQGATFLQRNGYSLADLVDRTLERAAVAPLSAGDEHDTAVSQAVREATGRAAAREPERPGADVGDPGVVVLGSGNLGLIYLMGESRRLTLEEIDERFPRLVATLRKHPHVGFVFARSEARGPVALGRGGAHFVADGTVEGDDPLAPFSPNAAGHLKRTDGFAHTADLMVNSFYDPGLEQGCAFEELISFHGGMGGAQTRPFLLAPAGLPLPDGDIIGAERVHEILTGWRRTLQGNDALAAAGEAGPDAMPTAGRS
jgi:uncharacterized membrane protein YvlD (DUF360 family)